MSARTRSTGVLVHHAGGDFFVDYATRHAFAPLYDSGALAHLGTLRPGACAWTVGANVGQWALPMARAVGADGWVLAVEPNPAAADLLERNLALNGLRAATAAAGRTRRRRAVGRAP